LQGRHALSLSAESDIRAAIVHFEQAITKDPGYAPPYAGIADAAVALTDYYVSPSETHGRGRRSAQRAIELDDSLAEAHTSLATIHMMFDWDWMAAEREYRRALQLRPSYADAHSWYAYYLAAMGRFDEAIEQVRAAETLDPLSVATHLNASWVYYLARKEDEAIAHVKRALTLDPHMSITHGSIWAAVCAHPRSGQQRGP
jgi:Tfp pilus assembly protein PilF